MSETLTDEMLMAYADGELDAPQRHRVERALSSDPSLKQRIRMFERTGRGLGEAFEMAEAAQTPPPPLREAGRPESWIAKLRAVFPAPNYGYGLAAAAMGAVLVGMAAYFGAQQGGQLLAQAEDGQLIASGALHTALEANPSRGFATGPGAAAAIVQTFQRDRGAFCREYLARAAAGQGIACREADGRWIIALHTADAGPAASPDGYAPAGSERAQLIDSYVHQIMQGDPLPADAERSVIEKGWKAD